ncbi:lasso peptide biosynthesis B2 protein [Deinococcus hopiensis]|uniref:Transglutaminase-like superfamily protein n=1 Tax=Deinococcus hopiensis KR-140 TaxID=695939 RepID=A0A1W1VEN4_9DEIO|nr:lasso peptide biosynthesis B2 protein [Deinococcus hopiensis]SMB91832.1 Transglutaminase-like superfamily protein [Deinococcus hopiensis KR-140]
MTLPDPSILVRALTTDPPQIGPEDVPHLLAAGLAGQVRMRLPQDHPLRAALRPGQLALGARHALIRAEVRLLLAAWAREGIPAMLFKGFALAEFEYGTPGERFYGDVDVLIPEDPTTVMRAVHIAISHGWRSDGQHAAPERWTHESAHLFSPGGQVRLDVHRFAVGWVSGTQERVRRVTAALWAKAGAVDWAGVPVWRPDLVDAVVFNLALGRQWSGDVGGLKPADYADLQRLTARHALTGTQLAARAREVGATHTWAAFREACDPLERHFALGSPDVGPTLVRAVQRDGLLGRRAVWQRRLIRLPRLLRWLPRLLPDAFAAWWAVRSGGDPRVPLARWTPASPPRPLALAEVQDAVLAAGWLTRLLYPRQSRVGTCVPRAYTTYRALRRLGHPVVFVSGVARTSRGIQGHAWVEDAHGTIDAYEEPLNRERFPEVFHFPAGERCP